MELIADEKDRKHCPKALFAKVAGCFPIHRHKRLGRVIYYDETEDFRTVERMEALGKVLEKQLSKEGWHVRRRDEIDFNYCVSVFRRFAKEYNLEVRRGQTTHYATVKRYLFIRKTDESTVDKPFVMEIKKTQLSLDFS